VKHTLVRIDLSEWSTSQESDREPIDAFTEFGTYISQRGYESLEDSIAAVLQGFLGQNVHQRECLEAEAPTRVRRYPRPGVYVSCFRKNEALVFVDIEALTLDTKTDKFLTYTLEADIFGRNTAEATSLREEVVDLCMKCFGLTGAKDDIVIDPARGDESEILKDRLTLPPVAESNLQERLREAADRAVLIELKKKSPVLERDLAKMGVAGTKRDRIKATLDFFSGQDYGLVEKKFAIICQETNQIIFLLRTKEEMDSAANLQCPKCSKPIQDELVMGYYAATEQLKGLIDGSKWMPYLIKDAFVHAGVPAEDVLVGAKYEEDEIDLLTFFRGRIFAVEAKDRPATLNDAYKLSAKTARLEAVLTQGLGLPAGRLKEGAVRSREHALVRRATLGNIRSRGLLTPVLISTQDIARDGKDLLKDTRPNSRFLENCEDNLEAFVENLVEEIELTELRRRFGVLTGDDPDVVDSVPQCASSLTALAFGRWLEQGLT